MTVREAPVRELVRTREPAATDALTLDGGVVRLRAVRPDDAAALTDLHKRAGQNSLRLRFFTISRASVDREVQRLIRPPDPDHVAVLAEEGGQVIGVASYERDPTAPDTADFAVLVDDRQHGRGVGTLLLEYLAAHARADGVAEMVGDVLSDNTAMLGLAQELSAVFRTDLRSGVVEVRLPTTIEEDALEALDRRERLAGSRSLQPVLRPHAVAVVGAGRSPGGIGHEVLRGILDYGFTGPVYPVNPYAEQIAGLRCYPRLTDLPGRVDLVVVAVPAHAVPAVVEDAARAGARGLVVLSSGFGEAGEEGRQRQRELVRLVRRHGMRLIGPNCIGVINTDPDVRLAATFTPNISLPGTRLAGGLPDTMTGGLGVASQSGAVGIALLEQAARTGTGISSFVSLGNKADVSGNDLLRYWYDDPATQAVALYLESFGNPRAFARTARALARRKPVLAVKSGRSEEGQRAGASHTAAAAAPNIAVDALFAQAGVIRTETLTELLDAARLLLSQPLPRGNRVGVLGNAGGLNVLAADAAHGAGLEMPSLSEQTRKALTAVLPTAATHNNPIDLGAAATPEGFRTAITQLAASGEVDALLVIFAATRANDVPGVLAAIGQATDEVELPTAAVLVGVGDPIQALRGARTPVYPMPEPAMRALGQAAHYAAWRAVPLGRRPRIEGVDARRARRIVHQALARGEGWQPASVITDLLSCYGIPLIPTMVADSALEAVRAATEVGFPVVLKAADPNLVHKSDYGGVQLHLTGPDEVTRAYEAIAVALKTPQPQVLVQPMVRGVVELVAGVVHDPLFGSLVMLGRGGTETDLLNDRAFRLLPVTDVDAEAMWRSLRCAPLLTGYRGSEPVPTSAVEDLVLRLGLLAEQIPEVAELDLNPVMANRDGVVAVDAKLRLAVVRAEPDPALRTLSPTDRERR